jgi:hypothetical protein
VESDRTGNRSGDHADQEDQRCRQEPSEYPPGRHTEPDQTGTEDARQDGTNRRCQHDAIGDLVELDLAAIEDRPCDEENPDVEDHQPGEEQHESAPIERRIDPSTGHRTSSAVRRIDHRRPSALREVKHPTNQVAKLILAEWCVKFL